MNRYRPPIRSPFPVKKAAPLPPGGDAHQAISSILHVQALVAELTRLRDQLTAALSSSAAHFDQVRQMKKGDKGDPGPTLGEIVAAVVPLIPVPEDGDDGDPGVSPDPEELAAKVRSLIEIPAPLPAERVDYDAAAQAVIALLHPALADPAKFVEHLATLPKGRRLKLEHIDGLKETIDALSRQTAGAMYLHGGGDTIKAGTGVTITRNADGTTTINSSGGGGFTTLAATETPDGVSTVFTFAAATAQPSFIVSDNVIMKAITKKGTVNWTWNNAAKQATMTIAPADDIGGIV